MRIPRTKTQTPRDIVIDRTALKVYGEDEWKVRTHGISKRRTSRKIHLGLDAHTQEVVCAVVTTNDVQDLRCLKDWSLKSKRGGINRVCADGVYDVKHCYECCYERGIEYLEPPREGAVVF